MCKLAAVTGPIRADNARRIIAAVNTTMAVSERDGFGFVSAGTGGVAFGKYVFPDSYGGFGVELPSFINRPAIESGSIPSESYSLLIHGRTSTNRVTLHNCHPFVKDGRFITHNGVLRWVDKGKEPKTKQGSDTESFFNWMLGEPKWQDKMEQCWAGWAAMFILDTKQRKTILIKDSATSLFAAKRTGRGWVFGTTRELVNTIVRAGTLRMSTGPLSLSPVVVPINEWGEFEAHRFGPRFSAERFQGWEQQAKLSLGSKASPPQWSYKEEKERSKNKFPDYQGKSNPCRIIDDDVYDDDPNEYTLDQALYEMDEERKAREKAEGLKNLSDLFPT